MGKEKKEEEEAQEMVLKVDMHREGCARKVARALKGFQEKVTMDYKESRVVVKGKNVDPLKVCERVERKSGRKVELISHMTKPFEENTKEEEIKKEEPKQQKKYEPPPEITLVLNVQMHCDPCAQVLKKRIRRIKVVNNTIQEKKEEEEEEEEDEEEDEDEDEDEDEEEDEDEDDDEDEDEEEDEDEDEDEEEEEEEDEDEEEEE